MSWLLLSFLCVCSLSSALDGLRHNADSYTDQQYYSHVIHEWSGTDGRVRLARFRAVPADGRHETGRLTDDEHKHVWDYLSVLLIITLSFVSISNNMLNCSLWKYSLSTLWANPRDPSNTTRLRSANKFHRPRALPPPPSRTKNIPNIYFPCVVSSWKIIN